MAKPVTPKKDAGKSVAHTGAGNVPAHLRDKMKADAGKGVSDNADDSLVPLVVVLQAQSPQAMKQKPEYLKGAEAGSIWMKNAPQPVVAGSEGILFQPCAFYKNVVEWIPKNKDGSGGGYVGEHATMPADAKEVVDKDDGSKKMMSPRGTEYVETRNHAGIIYTDDGQAYPYLIPLSSSGHSVSRQLTFMMRNKSMDGVKLASYACLYRLKTIMRTKGAHNWFVLDPHEGGEEDSVLYATEEQYDAGAALHLAFEKGEKKADLSGAEPEAGSADSSKSKEASKHI